MSGPGATKADWEHFAYRLGLVGDLLPVVSDPKAQISPRSSLRAVGKVPSLLDDQGRAVGVKRWTQKRATEAEVATWSQNERLGICVQTRQVRAIDIDIDDPALAERLENAFTRALGGLPCRSRPGTGKRLLLLRAAGHAQKRSFTVRGGQVELLATGQQFIAIGTHPSGCRYQWRGGLPVTIPEVTLARLLRAWEEVAAAFATETGPSKPAPNVDLDAGAGPLEFDRAATIGRASAQTIEDLRSALQSYPIEDADDYGTWISTGLALKSLATTEWSQQAEGLWHEFSRKSPKYDAAEADAKWAGLDPNQIDYRAIFKRAYKLGWIAPSRSAVMREGEDLTEAGALEVLARITDGNLRFVHERRMWIWWDGVRWHEDVTGVAAQRCALSVADEFRRMAASHRERLSQAPDSAAARAIKKDNAEHEAWWAACRSRRGISNVLALAMADSRFVISVNRLNANPWLLGVANGVVDLRDGVLRKGAREDLVTMHCPVAFEPAVVAPRWAAFVSEVTSAPGQGVVTPRPELAKYLQRFLGYCATGSTREHKLFLAIGKGANGKNVLFDTVQYVLGPYCQTVPPDLLASSPTQHDAERPSTLLAGLAGARLVVCSESRDGQRLDVSLVKRHTGGGYMKARDLREDPFQFEITHKLAIMTNHQPQLDSMDEAVRGRLHLMPFDMRWNRPGHPARDPNLPDGDKDLPETLKGEAAGILTWIVEGARDYYFDGLSEPDCVRSYTPEYLDEQDPFSRWLAECQRCDTRDGARASMLFESYQSWKLAHGEEGGPRIASSFAKALKDARVAKQTRRSDATYYGLQMPPGLQCGFI